MAEIHPTAARLYQAAATLPDPITGQSALAGALGETPQTLNNWEMPSRGVSKRGAAKAQAVLGISATWITEGQLPMLVGDTAQESQPARFDDATMTQAVDLLYLIADHRPDDPRFARLTWPMIQVAAKAIRRAEAGANQREVIAEILSAIK